MKIICPSRKRADAFLTDIENMVVLIDEKELVDYKNVPFEVITHPSLASLSLIRQYAYKMFGDVFFVDDDIKSVERVYTTENQKLTPKEAQTLIENTCYLSKQVGATLYGFNSDPSPTHYNQHKPFMLKGYINGCAMGLNNDKRLYFNEKTIACESHWINLLNLYYNRFCFIDKRFHFRQLENSTFLNTGGQAGKRTLDSEKKDTLLLRRYFGNSVELKKTQNKTTQMHEYQRVLNIKI